MSNSDTDNILPDFVWATEARPMVRLGDTAYALSTMRHPSPRFDTDGDHYGKPGRVIQFDHPDRIMPIRVKFEDGDELWLSSWSLTPVLPEPEPEKYKPVKGDRIRVVEANDGATPRFKAWAVGQTGTVDWCSPTASSVYVLLDGRPPFPTPNNLDNKFSVKTVQPETAESTPEPEPEAEYKPAIGDKVRVLEVLGWANSDYSAWAIGKEGIVYEFVDAGIRVKFDQACPYVDTPDGAYLATKVEPLTDEPYEPKVGDKVRVLDVMPAAYPEYKAYMVGRVGTVLELTADGPRLTFPEPVPPTIGSGQFSNLVAKVALVEPTPETDTEPTVEPDWTDLMFTLRNTLDEWAETKEWCSEYEQAIDRLFGWTSERNRQVDYDVDVTLTKNIDITDLADGGSVFGDDSANLESEHFILIGTVTLFVSGDPDDGPDRDDVEAALDNRGLTYDSFDITNYEQN